MLFGQIHNEVILRRIERCGAEVSPETTASNAAIFWRLTVATASERSWFMLHYSHTLPEMLAGILSKHRGDSSDCLARFEELGRALIEAEDAMRDPDHDDRVAHRSELNSFLCFCFVCQLKTNANSIYITSKLQ